VNTAATLDVLHPQAIAAFVLAIDGTLNPPTLHFLNRENGALTVNEYYWMPKGTLQKQSPESTGGTAPNLPLDSVTCTKRWGPDFSSDQLHNLTAAYVSHALPRFVTNTTHLVYPDPRLSARRAHMNWFLNSRTHDVDTNPLTKALTDEFPALRATPPTTITDAVETTADWVILFSTTPGAKSATYHCVQTYPAHGAGPLKQLTTPVHAALRGPDNDIRIYNGTTWVTCQTTIQHNDWKTLTLTPKSTPHNPWDINHKPTPASPGPEEHPHATHP
jgi:hypothetical protein